MAVELAGRDITIKKDGTTVAAVQSRDFTINNEPLDRTNDDSDGYQKLAGKSAMQSAGGTVEGLLEDDTLLAAATAGTALVQEYTIEIDGLGEIKGDFRLNSFQFQGAHNENAVYSFEIQSSGEFTYTPETP